MNLSSRIGSCLPLARLVCGVLLVWFGLGLVAPRSQGASAGSTTVTASLTEPSVEAGQAAEYRIDIVGAAPSGPPPAPSVDGLTIAFAGRSVTQQIDLGSLSRVTTTTFIYTVGTTKAGRFSIPGQDVPIGGSYLRTLPVTLTVQEGGQPGSPAQQVFVELILPKKSAYLGESIPIEVRTYFAVPIIYRVTPDLVLNGEGFSTQKFAQSGSGQQTVEGALYNVATSKSTVTGLKTGTLSIGPVEVEPIVRLPRPRTRRRGPFNDPFDAFYDNGFGGGINFQPDRQIKVTGEAVQVEIKPLPAQGKPADFGGAVGQFALEAQAEPRKAQTGDPITVHLMLSGRGNFDRVGAPTLTDDHGLRTYPPSARFKPNDDVNLSGVKTFDQVIIAEEPRTSLPGYTFQYFDPATGKYATLTTPPLAVKVEGSSLATPTPAPQTTTSAPAATPTPVPTPTPPPRRAEDILYIRTDDGPALDRAAFLPLHRRPVFWLVQAGGLGVLLAAGLIGLRRARARDGALRSKAARQRQQSELQRALQRPETGRRDFYSAATRLAVLRAAAATGRPEAKLGAEEIARARGLDDRTAGSLEEIFRRHDELAYSGAHVAQEPVPNEERRDVLATLETIRRR